MGGDLQLLTMPDGKQMCYFGSDTLNRKLDAGLDNIRDDVKELFALASIFQRVQGAGVGINNIMPVGTGPTIGTTVVRVSKNTQISTTYNSTAQAFCLVALNTSLKGSHAWVYVSSQGGLQANTVLACPTTF